MTAVNNYDDGIWDDLGDDDYDPFLNETPPEPVCYTCNDHGGVPAGRLVQLVLGRHVVVPCPDCNATRLNPRRVARRLRGWVWRLRHRPELTDEPPF